VVLGAAVGLPVVTWLWWRAEDALQRETTALSLEKAARSEAESALNTNRVTLARRLWTEGDLTEARRLLDETAKAFRTAEWHSLWRACHAERMVFREHRAAITRVAVNHQGNRIASADTTGLVHVWDTDTGQSVLRFQEPRNDGFCIAFDPDGRILVSSSTARPKTSRDAEVKVWDVGAGHVVGGFRRTVAASRAEFSPDGRHLIMLGTTTSVLNAATGAEVFSLEVPRGEILRLAWNSNGQCVFFSRADRSNTFILELAPAGVKERAYGSPPIEAINPNSLALSPDGKRVAWATQELAESQPRIRIWDLEAGREILTFVAHADPVLALAFGPDGRFLASSSQDRTVRVWEAATGQEVITLRGHARPVLRLTFTPDGSRLVTGGADQTVRVWDVAARDR